MVFRQRRRQNTGAGIQDKHEGRTAAFSVHDDKPLVSLNSIFSVINTGSRDTVQ